MDVSSTDKLEMWHDGGSLHGTIQRMTSLLPVNQPVDGLPYCGSTTGTSGSTYWAWGTSTDKVEVGVADFTDVRGGYVMITIGRQPPANGVCTPG